MSQEAFKISMEVVDIPVVQMALRDHFSDMPTTDEIFAKARSLGLTKLPAETAPHLGAQYTIDQPKDEWLVIGHDPIKDSGYPFVFYVERDDRGELWLDAHYAPPDVRWSLGNVFLFGPPAS